MNNYHWKGRQAHLRTPWPIENFGLHLSGDYVCYNRHLTPLEVIIFSGAEGKIK
jgi:hypothetical protein